MRAWREVRNFAWHRHEGMLVLRNLGLGQANCLESTLGSWIHKKYAIEISGGHTSAIISPRWVCGVIKRQKFAAGIFKTDFVIFWIRTRIVNPVISDLAIHKLLAFRTTYLCENAFSKLIIIKSETDHFWKNVEFVLRPPWHQSTNDWSAQKSSSESIPFTVDSLDDFFTPIHIKWIHPIHPITIQFIEVNLFSLYFLYHVVVLLLYTFFSRIVCIVMISLWTKIPLEICNGRLHVSLTSR